MTDAPPTPALIGILTVSDRASRGEYADEGGPAIRDYLREVLANPWEPRERIVADDLDTIAAVSERLSRRLDLEDFGPRGYTLEVSSPGLERPLRTPGHFGRSVGQKVKVKTKEPVSGSKVHEGALVSADAEAIVVASEGGELRVPYADIASAHTVFEWGTTRSGR